MVGRSLIGRPWDITEISAAVDGLPPVAVSSSQKAEIAVDHYRDILDFYPAAKGIRFARKHLAGYCDHAKLPKTDPLRIQICQSQNSTEVEQALEQAFLQMAEAA